MARKIMEFTASMGRDNGKRFQITEMSARAGHDWATRLFLAIASSGIEIDEDIAARGLAGVAAIAMPLLGKIPAATIKPLLNDLMACVQSVQEKGVRALIEDDFEEIATIFQVQKAVFELHVEPFTSGGLSTLVSSPTAQ